MLSLVWLVLLFAGLVLLFLLPLIRILTLVPLLTSLVTGLIAGLIALLLLAPVGLVALVPKILLLLISLFLLLTVHYDYLQGLEVDAEYFVAGCHALSRFANFCGVRVETAMRKMLTMR